MSHFATPENGDEGLCTGYQPAPPGMEDLCEKSPKPPSLSPDGKHFFLLKEKTRPSVSDLDRYHDFSGFDPNIGRHFRKSFYTHIVIRCFYRLGSEETKVTGLLEGAKIYYAQWSPNSRRLVIFVRDDRVLKNSFALVF
ncbi:OLC1v1004073C1 [Oldenlandia corymbosa var. corymbosa]|uniref:OLC1v1004073C1 n=1 Tax=Oldenlandia corymbosa var. corymbosa TaxID=529605 RepID=A0AAV1DBE0_OLDCO|nr:OLC1v1004073C1 [Oldenlandia corymbosa var. corymbosa]